MIFILVVSVYLFLRGSILVREEDKNVKGGVVLVNRLWTVFLGLYKIEKEPRKTCGGTSNGKSFQ